MNYILNAQLTIKEENQVGKIGKIYGQNGELIIRINNSFPENLTKPLWIEIDTLPVPLFIESLEMHGNTKAVVIFDDFETIPRATQLVGKILYSQHSPNPSPDGDWDYTLGYTLTDVTSQKSGRITTVINDDFNPLFEVETDDEMFLVPIAEEFIERIDERKKIITIRAPKGLFEL